ncbi:unnamed protein product [Brassicogethes aeneus]|uniref:Uncharacterized protein n=1 Tax=Brassicogethes aeneus TaxID=1431903 RepID=A0A9P0BCX5_BRAAE|nr:unnamed protein product [Brassicogethes aeneus]
MMHFPAKPEVQKIHFALLINHAKFHVSILINKKFTGVRLFSDTPGIETKFAGSSCNDLVAVDSSGSTIISGHFDKSIRFWDTRSESSANNIVLNGKVTSLDLTRESIWSRVPKLDCLSMMSRSLYIQRLRLLEHSSELHTLDYSSADSPAMTHRR